MDNVRRIAEPIEIIDHGNGCGAKLLGYVAEYSTALFFEFVLSVKAYVKVGFNVVQACNPPDLIFLVAAVFLVAVFFVARFLVAAFLVAVLRAPFFAAAFFGGVAFFGAGAAFLAAALAGSLACFVVCAMALPPNANVTNNTPISTLNPHLFISHPHDES